MKLLKNIHRSYYSFIQGLENLKFWLPIIWKDRDWDYDYTLEVLDAKLKKQLKYLKLKRDIYEVDLSVERIQLCINLLQKIRESYYGDEMHEYWKTNIIFERNDENSNVSVDFEDVEVRLDEYITKYPNDKRRILNSNMLKYDNPTDKQIAIGMSYLRHRRATKILFEVLGRNIESWWT